MDLDDDLSLGELALELGVLLLEFAQFSGLLAPVEFVLGEVLSATSLGLEGVDTPLVVGLSPGSELCLIEAVLTKVSADLAGALESCDSVDVGELVFCAELAAPGFGKDLGVGSIQVRCGGALLGLTPLHP